MLSVLACESAYGACRYAYKYNVNFQEIEGTCVKMLASDACKMRSRATFQVARLRYVFACTKN